MSMPKIECSGMDKCCAAASLLQSIALEETAISHILNAEGEKLQKAVKMDNYSCDELLKVNKSVEDMVDKITNLEIVLKSKLDLIKPILDDCDNKPEKPECKPEYKPECKPECKPEHKSEYKADYKPEHKPEPKADYKPDYKHDYKIEEGPRVKLEGKSEE